MNKITIELIKIQIKQKQARDIENHRLYERSFITTSERLNKQLDSFNTYAAAVGDIILQNETV